MALHNTLYGIQNRIFLIIILSCLVSYSLQVTAATLNEAKQLIRLKRFSEAHTALNKIANKGDAEAQYYLAVLYRNGHGTERDLEKAHYWFKKSARLNHTKSQYELGMSYKSGLGTGKNIQKAHYWFSRAAANKHNKAQRQLELLKSDNRQAGKSDEENFQLAVRAIQRNDLHELKKTIPHISPDETGVNNNSLLHIAAQQKNPAAASILLKSGINPSLLNDDGNNALMIAAASGDYALTKQILKYSKLNQTNQNGETALLLATKYGHRDLVKLLLDNRANLHTKDSHGLKAIDYAYKRQFSEITTLLLAHGSKPSKLGISTKTSTTITTSNTGFYKGWSKLMIAAWKGNLDQSRKLVKTIARSTSRTHRDTLP